MASTQCMMAMVKLSSYPLTKVYVLHMLNQRDNLMTDRQIKNIFDSNWGMTLQELSKQTGKTVPQLKKILMG